MSREKRHPELKNTVMLNLFRNLPRQERALSMEILKQVQDDGGGARFGLVVIPRSKPLPVIPSRRPPQVTRLPSVTRVSGPPKATERINAPTLVIPNLFRNLPRQERALSTEILKQVQNDEGGASFGLVVTPRSKPLPLIPSRRPPQVTCLLSVARGSGSPNATERINAPSLVIPNLLRNLPRQERSLSTEILKQVQDDGGGTNVGGDAVWWRFANWCI